MAKIKPLAEKHRFRRWLRRLFGRKARGGLLLGNIDEMHEVPVDDNLPFYICPLCGCKKMITTQSPRPDGYTIAQTIIDEVPPTDFQKKAIDYLKAVAPDAPECIIKLTAENLETLKVVSREEHLKMHQSYKS